jgi:hypothetical protein
MKLNFCTLFNSSYLSRGLVMYESLKKYCDDFHLYVYAFDDKCFQYLTSQHLEHLTVISLHEFENENLLAVKSSRSAAEYCWTCSASTIHYSITKYNLENCTYVDADMLFYSNPQVLIDEMKEKSVLITAHRYSEEYDQSTVSGRYCVQFVTFKNTAHGMKVLNWWKDACIDWCFSRVEDGKFGDQKYLDEFEPRFGNIHELENLGGGLAPWNVQQYSFKKENGKITGTELSTGKTFEAVFFHFHGLKFYENNIVGLTGVLYAISKEVIRLFYLPYLQLLNDASERISGVDNSFNPNGNSGIAPYGPISAGLKFRFYLSGVKKSLANITGKDLKKRIAHHYFIRNNNR